MTYINKRRPHDADTQYRTNEANTAAYLQSLRGQFIHYCKINGVSDAEKQQGLADLEKMVDHHRHMADQGLVDPASQDYTVVQ